MLRIFRHPLSLQSATPKSVNVPTTCRLVIVLPDTTNSHGETHRFVRAFFAVRGRGIGSGSGRAESSGLAAVGTTGCAQATIGGD